jgi:hypothetical protein
MRKKDVRKAEKAMAICVFLDDQPRFQPALARFGLAFVVTEGKNGILCNHKTRRTHF